MPAQTEDINFIPDQLKNERIHFRNKSYGTRISLILAIVTSIVAAGMFYYNYTVNSKINGYIQEMQEKEAKITELRKFGDEGYKLGIRLENVQEVLDSRIHMSTLLSELMKRVPTQQIIITDLTYNSAQGLTLKCEAKSSYSPIDVFSTNLLAKSDSGEESVFSSVKLADAYYDKNDGIIEFTLNIDVNEKLLSNLDIKDEGNGTD